MKNGIRDNFTHIEIKMAGEEIGAKLVKVSTSCVSKCKLKIRKHRRNRNRNLRRKRSKLKYLQQISNNSNSTTQKHSRELCSTLTVFDITDSDMNCERDANLRHPPPEVSEWQYQHQLAYWKSRAISLEYENRMLHAHIKKMCSQEIQDYADYVKDAQNPTSIAEATERDAVSDDVVTTETNSEICDNSNNMFGEMESKIRGMETAMKVNYEMQVERRKAQMWPNIPLNL